MPVAATLKFADVPAQTDKEAGCEAIAVFILVVTTATELDILLQLFVIST